VPELHAMELRVPDMTRASAGPVVITLPVVRCTGPTVEQLKDVLATHPGVTEVRLRLQGRSSTTVMRLDERLRVSPTPALMADLKALLGPRCLTP
jgi:DNA polymerase III subunit alpha